MTNNAPLPVNISLLTKSAKLSLQYEDGSEYELSFEFLRVHSPSADVKGHGPDDAVLQVGKEHVQIERIEPVGNYALKLHFTDGHNTGLYTWQYLHELGTNQDRLWQEYLAELKKAGYERTP